MALSGRYTTDATQQRTWALVSVIANLPIIWQFSHREQLILNRAQVVILDRMTVPDTTRRQAPRADPATDRLRVLADMVNGLSDGQHSQMVRAAADPRPVRAPYLRHVSHGRREQRNRL